MKPDPTTERKPWRSSDLPPWLMISANSPWPDCTSGRASKTTPAFFQEISHTFEFPSFEAIRDWDTFTKQLLELLTGDSSRKSIAVRHAEDLFLWEEDYAKEMGRFLSVFLKANEEMSSRGAVKRPLVVLMLHTDAGLEGLLREKVLEGLAEAG